MSSRFYHYEDMPEGSVIHDEMKKDHEKLDADLRATALQGYKRIFDEVMWPMFGMADPTLHIMGAIHEVDRQESIAHEVSAISSFSAYWKFKYNVDTDSDYEEGRT